MALPVILFIDEVCNKPYDPHVLANEALGGTEATVVRVAEGLAATGLFWVTVEQHNRTAQHRNVREDAHNVVYHRSGWLTHADYVISLRSPDTLRRAKERFPKAKHFLWNHDLMVPSTAQALVSQTDYTAIAVSNFHRTQIQQTLYPQGYTGQFQVKVIYNPIADDLAPDSTPVDPNKLVFFSSPHKGLDYALEVFSNLLSFNPDFKLYVANPGYLPSVRTEQDKVVVLGTLPHHEALAHVRAALCSFLPNRNFPETFGLVFAESNAVGTPVLTHPIGAAREVLFHPSETLDCRSVKSVIDRVMAWHSGNRPKVKANPKFRLSFVIASWRKLLDV